MIMWLINFSLSKIIFDGVSDVIPNNINLNEVRDTTHICSLLILSVC